MVKEDDEGQTERWAGKRVVVAVVVVVMKTKKKVVVVVVAAAVQTWQGLSSSNHVQRAVRKTNSLSHSPRTLH